MTEERDDPIPEDEDEGSEALPEDDPEVVQEPPVEEGL